MVNIYSEIIMIIINIIMNSFDSLYINLCQYGNNNNNKNVVNKPSTEWERKD